VEREKAKDEENVKEKEFTLDNKNVAAIESNAGKRKFAENFLEMTKLYKWTCQSHTKWM